LADFREIDLARRALEQDVCRLAEKGDRPRQHQAADSRRHQRIDPEPARDAHQYRGKRDSERPERVAQHLEVRRLQVEAMLASFVQERDRHDVGGEPGDGDGHHQAGMDLGGASASCRPREEDRSRSRVARKMNAARISAIQLEVYSGSARLGSAIAP
jgi:hypothetical protein